MAKNTRNYVLVQRNQRRVLEFLQKGDSADDMKCRNITGVNVEQLRAHMTKFVNTDVSWVNMRDHYMVAFEVINANRVDISNSTGRGVAFQCDNLSLKPVSRA
jgi:hypothetical protein